MSWTEYWAAGGHAAQPLYDQFQHGDCQEGVAPSRGPWCSVGLIARPHRGTHTGAGAGESIVGTGAEEVTPWHRSIRSSAPIMSFARSEAKSGRSARSGRGRRFPAIIGTGWLNHYPVAYGYGIE